MEKRDFNFDVIIGQMWDGWPLYNINELVTYILNNEPNDSLVILMRVVFQEEDKKKKLLNILMRLSVFVVK